MKPIITEDEIKKFAKDECIKIINRTELFHPMSNMEIFPESNIDGEWHYEENRNDNFAKWRKHNLTNQMFNQDVIGNDVFE